MPVVVFIAFRLLWHRRLLNGVAVAGVLLGVVALIGIRGIMRGFQDKFLLNILKANAHVAIFSKELRPTPRLLDAYVEGPYTAEIAKQTPSDRELRIKRPTEILRTLESMDGVAAASPILVGSAIVAFGQKEISVSLRGIEPEKQEEVTPLAGYLTSGDMRSFAASPDGALLGSGVAKDLGAKVGDLIVCSTPAGAPLTLKVSGVFETEVTPIDHSRVYTTLRTAQTLLGKPDIVGEINVKMTDPELAHTLAERVEKIFHYDAESWKETYSNFLALFRQQDVILGFITGTILIVGGFAILVIQIMIVLQKSRDIAILRSTGFQRRDILLVFLLQGIVIALIGSAAGCVSGHFLLDFLGSLKIKQETLIKSDHFLVVDDPKMYGYATAFALVTGVIASLLPAVRASQVEPVDVLRGQVG
ncbi:MAG: ABC transporter permease [Bdellovibrionota bacterium]